MAARSTRRTGAKKKTSAAGAATRKRATTRRGAGGGAPRKKKGGTKVATTSAGRPARGRAAARKPAAKKATAAKSAVKKADPKKAAGKKASSQRGRAAKPPAAKPARRGVPRVTNHGSPVGWPQLSLYLTVRDPAASLRFYESAYGFEPTGETMTDAEGRIQHAGMRLGDAAIMFAPEQAANPMRAPASSGAPDSLSFYIYVRDVDALARRATDAGATVLQAPADQFWGDRIAVFKCPDGYHWTFATHVSEFDPSEAPQ